MTEPRQSLFSDVRRKLTAHFVTLREPCELPVWLVGAQSIVLLWLGVYGIVSWVSG